MAKYGSGEKVSVDNMLRALMSKAGMQYKEEASHICAANMLNHVLNGTMDVYFIRKYLNEVL